MVNMLFGVAKWFTGAEKRTAPRKETQYAVHWVGADGKTVTANGVEISAGGMTFLTQIPLPAKEHTVVATLRSTHMPIRILVERESITAVNGAPWRRISAKMLGISADHWDLVIREVHNIAEPVNAAAAQLNEIAKKVDNDYRLLPLQVQRQIIRMLVTSNRLDEVAEGQMPTVRMEGLGSTKAADGRTLRRVNIHSRRHVQDMTVSYDTIFSIDEDGNVEAPQLTSPS
jgi:hypothetical protein